MSMDITAFLDGILCISLDRYHISEQCSASIFKEKKARDYSSTLKLEAASFSETLVLIYQTVWHHVPEDSALQVEAPQMKWCLTRVTSLNAVLETRTLCPLLQYNTKNQINIECKSQKWFPARVLALMSWKCTNSWLLFMFNMPCYSLSRISNWINCAVQVFALTRLNNLLFLWWVYCYYSNMGQICPWCTLEERWDESFA